MNTLQLLKQNGGDFEWYPTTDEIIGAMRDTLDNGESILDIGAGDGRVLMALKESFHKLYAIEKAKPLIDAMPDEIFIIGTDFRQETLIDKRVSCVFCNPPFSEYEAWAEKIILEANAESVYLVMPERWKNIPELKTAIKARGATYLLVGEYSFLEGDRKARGTVNLVKILLATERAWVKNPPPNTDPFDVWFEREFRFKADQTDDDIEKVERETTQQRLRRNIKTALVDGKNQVEAMVGIYQAEMTELLQNFKSVSRLDQDLLRTLGVSKEGLCEALKKRISGLKDLYWQELFDRFDGIADRLTKENRESFRKTLMENTSVGFSAENIYAVAAWVIKSASRYYDAQLVSLCEDMVDKANVALYKSNKRVYEDREWRYSKWRDFDGQRPSHFGFELRVVMHGVGGIHDGQSWSWRNRSGLTERAYDFMTDLLVVCRNLGYNPKESMDEREWRGGAPRKFTRENGNLILEARAFKNGNIHIRFGQEVIRKINIEFGRLKGWLRTPDQASEELDIPIEEAKEIFGSNLRLSLEMVPLLGFSPEK